VRSCPPYVQNLLILAQLYGALARDTWVRKFMSAVTSGIEAAETKGARIASWLRSGSGTGRTRAPKPRPAGGYPRLVDEGHSAYPNYCVDGSRSRSPRTARGEPSFIAVAGWRPISGGRCSVLARRQSL
jgi:hypothetical protein